MSITISDIPVSWVIVPAPWRVDAPPQAGDQKWLMTLSGIADINFQGNSTDTWRHETFKLILGWRDPVMFAFEQTGQAYPGGMDIFFSVELWSQFATINSIKNEGHSINAGYAVNSCNPIIDSYLRNRFSGLEVVVGAQDTDSYLFKVGFQVTLLGKIFFSPQVNFESDTGTKDQPLTQDRQ